MSLQRELRKQIAHNFDTEEIKTLCFDLNLPFDELPGDRLSSKITALLIAVYRMGKLELLHDILSEERPTVEWPKLPVVLELDWDQLAETVTLPPVIEKRIYSIGNVGDNSQVVQGDHNTVLGAGAINLPGNSGQVDIQTGGERTEIGTQFNVDKVEGDLVGRDNVAGDSFNAGRDIVRKENRFSEGASLYEGTVNQFFISINGVESDPEFLATLTQRLRAEIFELDVDDVVVPQTKAPFQEGSKSLGSHDWGSLIVTMGSDRAGATRFMHLLVDWLQRNGGNELEVTLPNGDALTIQGDMGPGKIDQAVNRIVSAVE